MSSVKTHLLYECGQTPRFRCPACHYRCKIKSNMFKHIRNSHSAMADILTPVQDGALMKNDTTGSDREKEYTWDNSANIKPFGRLFGRGGDLYAKVLGSSGCGGGGGGGGFTCTRCGNSYARPHSLSRHLRFECGVDPKFECPICHKKSKHKHNLMLHMRTHQNRVFWSRPRRAERVSPRFASRAGNIFAWTLALGTVPICCGQRPRKRRIRNPPEDASNMDSETSGPPFVTTQSAPEDSAL
ncbi:hypothetical protein AAG570_013984 [Ranatra chinensis]|uniref:C2H2-type domain-containing protein n=1 Tax=Ranatra chinensis TaxID=642074 RepID=A0ABD0Z017_9HEMI